MTNTTSCLRACLAHAWPLALLLVLPRGARAQTDFMNTDRGRPFAVEDALTVERWALEVQLSPVRIERTAGAATRVSTTPGFNFGLLPRVELTVEFPLVERHTGSKRTLSLAGLEVGLLHQLNAESEHLPAFGLRLDATLPVGGLAPSHEYTSVGVLATRSFDAGIRLHANANANLAGGSTLPIVGDPEARFHSNWSAGVALDKTFPLHFALVGIEGMLREPNGMPGAREWSVGLGARLQVDPRWSLDAGLGRSGGAGDDTWFASVGATWALGWRFGIVPGGH